MADANARAPLWLWGLAALPGALAIVELGRVHPDEVYQLLEPAWFKAFGYGILAWEWQQGLRNWALPLLAAGLLRSGAAIGLTHPQAYRALLAIPQVLLHGWMLVAVYRYIRRRVPGEASAAAAAVV